MFSWGEAGLVSRGELRCFWWVMFWCGRCGEFSLGLASPGKAGSVWLLWFVVVW